MEREFKWEADAELQHQALELLFDHAAAPVKTIEMDAHYFDTADGMLRNQKIGLRLRSENDRSICCMKLRTAPVSGLHEHEEYEVAAVSLTEGLRLLPGIGAPQEICSRLLEQQLIEIAHVRFTRSALTVAAYGCTAELALDAGSLGNGSRSKPLCEIELEMQSGDHEAFLRLGEQLENSLHLKPQPLSKLARAVSC